MEKKFEKKNSKVALLIHRRSLKKNCGLAGTYCRSLSPEVAILNETNFYISVSDYLVADCHSTNKTHRAVFGQDHCAKNGSLNRQWASLFVLQTFMCVAFYWLCFLVPYLGTVLQFSLFSSYITDVGRSQLNAICQLQYFEVGHKQKKNARKDANYTVVGSV